MVKKRIQQSLIFISLISTLLFVESAWAVRRGYNVYSRPGDKSSIFKNTRDHKFSYAGKSKNGYLWVSYKEGGKTRHAWVSRRAVTQSEIRNYRRSKQNSAAVNKIKFPLPKGYKFNNDYRVRTGPSLNAGIDSRKKAKNCKLTGFQSENKDWVETRCPGHSAARWIHRKGLEVTETQPEKSERLVDDTVSPGGEVTSTQGEKVQETMPLPQKKTKEMDEAAGKQLEAQKKAQAKKAKDKKKKSKNLRTKTKTNAAHLTRVCKRVLKKWRGSAWRRSRRLCYRGVKKCLQAAGLVPDYLPGGHAKVAGKHLLKRGFKKLKTLNPHKAPAGAVIVYRHPTRRSHPGHIDIKGSDGKYYSDFQQRGPGTGWGRKVIGIYIK